MVFQSKRLSCVCKISRLLSLTDNCAQKRSDPLGNRRTNNDLDRENYFRHSNRRLAFINLDKHFENFESRRVFATLCTHLSGNCLKAIHLLLSNRYYIFYFQNLFYCDVSL